MLIVARSRRMRETAATQALAGLATLDKDLMEAGRQRRRGRPRLHRRASPPVRAARRARRRRAMRSRPTSPRQQRANPLFVDLDDPDPSPPAALDEMRAKQREAAAKLAKPAYISADGRTQVIILRTAFRATDVARDLRLMGSLDQLATRIQLAHPGRRSGSRWPGGHGRGARCADPRILLSSVITFRARGARAVRLPAQRPHPPLCCPRTSSPRP